MPSPLPTIPPPPMKISHFRGKLANHAPQQVMWSREYSRYSWKHFWTWRRKVLTGINSRKR
jgi:hypothetical protein